MNVNTMKSMDEKFMRMALRLAAKARGWTSPNPMVGAVVVRDGRVIASGYHQRAGGQHAEAIALAQAGRAAQGETLYVTLEPCSHTDKRTPPCTPLVIASRVKRVVVAMIDPNPRVSGRGIRSIRQAGIEVTTGVLETEARLLNEAFIKHVKKKVPFVTLKIAQTLDGRIATASGESKWITGKKEREEGRRLRSSNDAILVGINTVLKDDPALTARILKGRDPIRIIVDSRLRIPLGAKVLTERSPAKTIVATLAGASKAKLEKVRSAGAEVLIVKSDRGRVDLKDLMRRLGRMDIMSVLIEGGSEINASALREGIVDKVMIIIAPTLMTGRDSLCSIGGISPKRLRDAISVSECSSRVIDRDLIVEGYIRKT